MVRSASRRGLMKGAAGALATSSFMLGLQPRRRAWAAEKLVVVEWGGAYINSIKEIAAKQDAADITWELHAGGAAAILPKVQATWPKPRYDLVAAWDPVFTTMINEDWLETITPESVPNLQDVPKYLILTDDKGNWKTIPQSVDGLFWSYREDTCPIKIEHIEDLLSPKLKGQILFPDPILNNNLQMVTLALAGGGSEHNMEPAWDFVKELAKRGNIGRVSHTDNDFVTSFTTGETSVGYGDAADATSVGKQFPMKYLTKVPGDKGLKTNINTTGWAVLKGGNTKAALAFANFTMTPENDEIYNSALGTLPSNSKAKADPKLAFLKFTEDEAKEFTYRPDWTFLSKQVAGWQKRWEQEVAPLLR